MHNAEEFPVSQAADYAHADRGRNLSDLHGNGFRRLYHQQSEGYLLSPLSSACDIQDGCRQLPAVLIGGSIMIKHFTFL